ncbi:MAG TPA: LysM peptidoglycan-binding domain-containing protein [Gammaproteobacteria bacterium]|nr:LysM peptidoglycan-binding domain-containing protein [Gammaproteobacteria bacterium]
MLAALAGPARADTVVLNPDHPGRYVVVPGDTLWGIAARFLRNPWKWPDIWYINPAIENPHLIYPGDVISLVMRNGEPVLMLERAPENARPAFKMSPALNTEKLSPQVRIEKLERAIPTLPMDAIQQFLLDVYVVGKQEVDHAPYIVAMEEGHLVAAANDTVYARGMMDKSTARYQAFRTGRVYRDPDTEDDEIIGYEALRVGTARVEAFGDPTTLTFLDSSREVLIGDRLLPFPENSTLDTHFIPRAPETDIHGRIIAMFDAVARVGQFQVVVLNRGHADGVRPGHVFAAFRSGDKVRDLITARKKGQTVTLPDARSGLIMVFRTFDRVSYGLVTQASRDIRLHDTVGNP